MPPATETAIPYEILRRNDGVMALSVNAGLIGFKPAHFHMENGCAIITSLERRSTVTLVNIAKDAALFFSKTKLVRLYEFNAAGIHQAHRLDCSSANYYAR